MHIHRPSPPELLRQSAAASARLAVLLLAALVGLAGGAPGILPAAVRGAAAAPPPQADALAKIEPALLAEVRSAGTTGFFVWLTAQADLAPAALLPTKQEKGAFVFNALRTTAERSQQALRAELEAQGIGYQPFYIANKIYVEAGDTRTVLRLAERADVAKLTANHEYQVELPEPVAAPTAQTGGVEPNLTFIHADQVWAQGVTGAGVVLAANDTGLQWDHPAIKPHYRGWNGVTVDHNYNWWDATGAYPAAPVDEDGHGTHVTGIMVGDDGVNHIGIAPGAKTIHCKYLSEERTATTLAVTSCLQWNLAPWDLSGANPRPDLAPDVVNNSWQGDATVAEIGALQAAGIVVVASAGNQGPSCSTVTWPGSYGPMLTVGAIDPASGALPGTVSEFSSRGPSVLDVQNYFPDVMAPGQSIRSSLPGDQYARLQGTSQAAPHVAGLAGLLWSANPALRGMVEQTAALIQTTAVPLTGQTGSNCGGNYATGPNNDWGHGTIDALTAVEAARTVAAGTVHGVVTDAATGQPVANATVVIADSRSNAATLTDAAGFYTRPMPQGVYTVTATLYGYMPGMASSVIVTVGDVTNQSIALLPAPRYSVEGTVKDSLTGWPLMALIQIAGYPGEPVISDPMTGHYRVELAAGLPYVIRAQAYAPGYLAGEIALGPLSGNTSQPLILTADPNQCEVTGYTWGSGGACIAPNHGGLVMGFVYDDNTQEPIFALVENEDGYQTYTFARNVYMLFSPAGQKHFTATSGAFRPAQVTVTAPEGGRVRQDFYLTSGKPVIDHPMLHAALGPGQATTLPLTITNIGALQMSYAIDLKPIGFAPANVQPTSAGNVAWLAAAPLSGTLPVSGSQVVAITFDAGAAAVDQPGAYHAALQLDTDTPYEVEAIPVTMTVAPPAGWGKLQGTVRGLGKCDTSPAPLPGAQITIGGADASEQVLLADASGVYTRWLAASAGPYAITVSAANHVTRTAPAVAVPAGNAVTQDFDLRLVEPCIGAMTPALAITLTPGVTQTVQVQVENQGAASGAFRLFERLAPATPPAAGKSTGPEPTGLAMPANGRSPAGPVLQTWPPAANRQPAGIAWTRDQRVWVGNLGEPPFLHEYTPDGVATGRSYTHPWPPGQRIFDLTYNAVTGRLWALTRPPGGSTAICIYELDPAGGFTGATICPAWGDNPFGLAYDPYTDTYFLSDLTSRRLYRSAADGSLLETIGVGWELAGLAYNSNTQHLFGIDLQDRRIDVHVLDGANNYSELRRFTMWSFTPQGGRGLEIDCSGNLWAVDGDAAQVYQVVSGESTSQCQLGDLPWVTAAPITGAVAADSTFPLSITFTTAGMTQPGLYSGELGMAQLLPIRAPAIFPLSLHVVYPAVHFAQAVYTATGAAQAVTVAVSLDGPTGLPVTVGYTVGEPAARGAAGQLTFAPGALTQTFVVTVTGLPAPSVLPLTLHDPVNATLGAPAAATLALAQPNRPPVVEPIADLTVRVGDSVTFQVHASDADGDPLTFGAAGLPGDLAIDPVTGLIAGQPGTGSAGIYAVTATASDPQGATGQASFTLTVVTPTALAPGEEPTFTEYLYLPAIMQR